MGHTALRLASLAWLVFAWAAHAEKVVDIPTRSGVTQRFVVMPAPDPKAAVILFAGGHGGLQFDDSGRPRWGRNNFLVRSAGLFAAQGLTVAVMDAPSDRQSEPFLSGFRQTAEHAADVRQSSRGSKLKARSRYGWSARAAARNRPLRQRSRSEAVALTDSCSLRRYSPTRAGVRSPISRSTL
jgi:hypothetical protein